MKGAVYVAFGAPAVRCLRESASALVRHEPGIAILVLSDRQVRGMNTRVVQTSDRGARSIKTQLPDLVPVDWTEVVYLDVDTIPLRPLDRFWGPLAKGWDMVACRDETAAEVLYCRLKNREELGYTITSLGTSQVTQMAGGLMAWRQNKRTKAFFRMWHREWQRFGYRDQGALTRAFARVTLKVWPLEYQANATSREEAVEVWHQHGRARRKGAQ